MRFNLIYDIKMNLDSCDHGLCKGNEALVYLKKKETCTI